MNSSYHNAVALWLSGSRPGVALLHAGVYLRYRRNFRWHLGFALRNLMPWWEHKPPPSAPSPQT